MKIENFNKGPFQRENILAEFDIELEDHQWGITFHKWQLIRSVKGNKFISGPSFAKMDMNGIKKYFPYIELKGEKKRDFEREVMKLLAEFITI